MKEELPCKAGQSIPTNIQVNPSTEFQGFETGCCAAAGRLLVNYKNTNYMTQIPHVGKFHVILSFGTKSKCGI